MVSVGSVTRGALDIGRRLLPLPEGENGKPPKPSQMAAWVEANMELMVERGTLPIDWRSQMSSTRVPCSSCNRKGYEVDPTTGDETYCLVCRGYGSVPAEAAAACSLCRGDGWIRNPKWRPGNREPNSIECTRCTSPEQRVYTLQRQAGIPEKYLGWTLNGWIKKTAGQNAHVLDAVWSWARGTLSEETGYYGLFLHGGWGLGKTGAAAGATWELFAEGGHVDLRWIAWPMFCEQLNELMSVREAWMGYIDMYARSRYLIIDDLGMEEAGTDHKNRVLTMILERRANKPTLITSMFGLGELSGKYSEYAVDRIFELCVPVELEGHSLRRRAP